MSQLRCNFAKRGDTIIEVMFAFTIFSLVAILSVTVMNLGVAASERSLEMTVVRNEINAQAEALRFIHSSYIAEINLPNPTDPSLDAETRQKCANDPRFKCQQYSALWKKITGIAREPANSADINNRYTIEMPVTNCNDIYKDDSELLIRNKAFVLNTRKLLARKNSLDAAYNSEADALIQALAPHWPDVPELLFREAPLNARIVYSRNTGANGEDDGDNSTRGLDPLSEYTRVARVEGIWVVGVRGYATGSSTGEPQFYDFFISSCWNGSNSPAASSIDTVVRLYNPEKMSI